MKGVVASRIMNLNNVSPQQDVRYKRSCGFVFAQIHSISGCDCPQKKFPRLFCLPEKFVLIQPLSGQAKTFVENFSTCALTHG
jgi:hypothetical protein